MYSETHAEKQNPTTRNNPRSLTTRRTKTSPASQANDIMTEAVTAILLQKMFCSAEKHDIFVYVQFLKLFLVTSSVCLFSKHKAG